VEPVFGQIRQGPDQAGSTRGAAVSGLQRACDDGRDDGRLVKFQAGQRGNEGPEHDHTGGRERWKILQKP